MQDANAELIERLRDAEASYRLEWHDPGDLVSAAVALAEAGTASPAIIDLAGDDSAPREEVLRDLDRVLLEVGLDPLTAVDALQREAARLGRRYLDGELDASGLAARIWTLWNLAGMPEDALGALELATAVYVDEPEYTSEEEYRETVAAFVSMWRSGQARVK